jgi:DNA-binding transcriptional regulator YiaG
MTETRWTPEAIKALRLRLGLTREDVAVRLNVRATTVYRWESGRAVPLRVFARQLDALAEAAR